MEEVVQKSYNPFKMWGSWVGILLYPLLTAIFWTGINQLKGFPKFLEYIIGGPIYLFVWIGSQIIELGGCSGEDCLGLWILNFIVSSIVAGFLIGWGIHSLIRKFKN